jgi:hypothetical protein
VSVWSTATNVADQSFAQMAQTLEAALATLIPSGRQANLSLSTFFLNNAVHNVKDYGAVGDGVADDTAAILAAATAAAQSDGAKVVGFPRGTYNCRPNQLILGVSPTDFTGVKFMGPGRGAAVIKKIDNGDLIRSFMDLRLMEMVLVDGLGGESTSKRVVRTSSGALGRLRIPLARVSSGLESGEHTRWWRIRGFTRTSLQRVL